LLLGPLLSLLLLLPFLDIEHQIYSLLFSWSLYSYSFSKVWGINIQYVYSTVLLLLGSTLSPLLLLSLIDI
jgi:hypothetical protein